MAVKPWLGAIKQPSNFIPSQNDLNRHPSIEVRLDYVYGIRCKDKRNNLFYHEGHLFYYAAALGIKLDFESNTQSFLEPHQDDVISMAFDRKSGLFATGELGPKPAIYIWSAETMQLIRSLKGGVIKGLECLSFSPDGSKLAGVCIDDNHMVVVFEVSSGELLFCEKGDTAKILDVCWVEDGQFVTVGIKHYKVWTITGRRISEQKGIFGKFSNLLTCSKSRSKVVYCGSTSGDL